MQSASSSSSEDIGTVVSMARGSVKEAFDSLADPSLGKKGFDGGSEATKPPPAKRHSAQVPAPPSATGLVRAEMERVTSEAERDRLGQRQAQRHLRTAKRSATSSFSREEKAHRRHQRQNAESDGEAEGAATATLDEVRFKYIARLFGEEAAAEVMRTRPTRCPPDVVLEHPHQAGDGEAEGAEDWTIGEGSNWDPEKWELELERRERRNKLIRARQ